MVKKIKPLTLSIIIPVYNDARYLRACLESIQEQSVAPDEVIVVDNNSTDSSAEVALEYDFVTLLKEKKQGVFYARNKGFNSAHSQILGRIDSDTILPKDWVAFVKHFYTDPKRQDDALTGSGYFYNIPLRWIHRLVVGQVTFRMNRFLLGHYIVWGSNMAIPRKMWVAVRDDVCEREDIHEDLDLAIHLHRHAFQITYRSKLVVGVVMRRVLTDFGSLRPRMLMWPNTLKAHHNPKWIFGWLGAYALFIFSPLIIIANKIRGG
jgi:glycosyltransferase involved in cell wall biosynthesis